MPAGQTEWFGFKRGFQKFMLQNACANRQLQSLRNLALAIGVSVVAALSISQATNARTVGAFVLGSCDGGNCEILDPRNNTPIESGGWGWLSSKDLKIANKRYKTIARADSILKKRGFPDTSRVALIYAFAINARLKHAGVAAEVYLRRVHGNTMDEIGALTFKYPLGILTQFAAYSDAAYHPVTGKRLSIKSIIQKARSVPDCYKNGQPHRDCKPLRYNEWTGCLLTDSGRKHLANFQHWLVDGLADLPTIPEKASKSRVSLKKAKRKKKKKTRVASARDPNNPAGRKSCPY